MTMPSEFFFFLRGRGRWWCGVAIELFMLIGVFNFDPQIEPFSVHLYSVSVVTEQCKLALTKLFP